MRKKRNPSSRNLLSWKLKESLIFYQFFTTRQHSDEPATAHLSEQASVSLCFLSYKLNIWGFWDDVGTK